MTICCHDSVSVVLFADGARASGTEEVVFDTKQAEKIYYFRDFNNDILALVVTIEVQTGGMAITNLSNCGDLDKNTFCNLSSDNTPPETGVIRFDFGTQASRNIILRSRTVVPGGGTLKSRWAGSDLVFSSFEDEIESSSTTDNAMQFGTQNLRYVEVEVVGTDSGGYVVQLNAMWDSLTVGGNSDVNIQVKNNITGNWFTVDTLSQITTNQEKLDTKTAIQPNNSLTRIQLVNTNGGWTGSVGAILVDPKFV